MTNKRKWTAMLLGVCILLSLLTACAPAGTINGSSSVPETASSVPAAEGSVSSENKNPTSSTQVIDPETGESLPIDRYDPLPKGYEMNQVLDEEYAKGRQDWMAWKVAWSNAWYEQITYNDEVRAILPNTDGSILYRQENPGSKPEIVCELPIYERISDAWYFEAEGKEKPIVFIRTRRSKIYRYDENTEKLTHLCELPVEDEDILSWGVSKEGKISIVVATEETYRLLEQLEARRGERIDTEEQATLCLELRKSHEGYLIDGETGTCTKFQPEYPNGLGQLVPEFR